MPWYPALISSARTCDSSTTCSPGTVGWSFSARSHSLRGAALNQSSPNSCRCGCVSGENTRPAYRKNEGRRSYWCAGTNSARGLARTVNVSTTVSVTDEDARWSHSSRSSALRGFAFSDP